MSIHVSDATQTAEDISRATSVESEMHTNILKHSYQKLFFFTRISSHKGNLLGGVPI